MKSLRKFLIALLDDPDGINQEAYLELEAMLADTANHECEDIMDMVQGCEGRYYLPDVHGLIP